MKFQRIHSEIVFSGRAFDVRLDKVKLPDGQTTVLNIVDHAPAVVLVPVDEQQEIWFIRQYRHAAERVIFELPAGVIETGESPEACAAREIREEIGMAAGELTKIGGFYLAPGYSTEYLHIYLARGLTPSPLPGDLDEFIRVERVSSEKAFQMLDQSEIHDGKTLAALALARPYLI